MIRLILIITLLSACTHKMSHTKHGVVVFDAAPGNYLISDENFSSTACNKLFIFIPYEMQFFNQDEKFREELAKKMGRGLAHVEMKESFYYNFFKLKWCQSISGKILRSETTGN